MRGEDDRKRVFKISKVCSYSNSGPLVVALGVGGRRSLSTSRIWGSKKIYQLWTRLLHVSFYGEPLQTIFAGLWILHSTPVRTAFLQLNTTALSISAEF